MTAHTNPALEALRAQRDEAQRRMAHFAIINRVSRLMASSLSFDELVRSAVEATCEGFRFSYLAAGMIDPNDPEWIALLARAGPLAATATLRERVSIHQGLIGLAARSRQRVLVNDVVKDPRYLPLPGEPEVYACLVVPIVANDQLLGLINIESDRPLDEEEAEAIEIIADQFGAVLENARLFGGLQRALATTQLLYETSQRISTAMRVEEVVVAYLEQVAGGGRYHSSVATDELDEQDRRTGLLVHGRWNPRFGMQLEKERLPYLFTGFDADLDAGQVITMRDVHAEPRASEEFRQAQRRVGRVAVALIPLIVRGRRIGLVGLSHPDPHDWLETELQPFQVTAALLASAIDSRRQHLLVAERSQELAVLEERRRLARELHDSVTQSLVGVNMLAQTVPDLWAIDRERAEGFLDQIRDLTRAALDEMRELLFELRPPGPGGLSLAEALKHQGARFEGRTGVAVELEVEETVLPDPVRQALLRITLEALTNVGHHAQARRVTLSLRGGRPTRLRIADDGRGFVPAEVGERSFGLVSMRERAANIQARLTLRSAPGAGTEIVVEWPDPGPDGRRRGTDGTDTDRDRRRSPDRPAGSGRGDADSAGHGAGRRGAKRSRGD